MKDIKNISTSGNNCLIDGFKSFFGVSVPSITKFYQLPQQISMFNFLLCLLTISFANIGELYDICEMPNASQEEKYRN